MKNTDILSRINALLFKVKLDQQTLKNGTVVEADSFVPGADIFAIDGDNKTPLEIGDYPLEDGTVISVTEIGVIGEIATAEAEATEVEAEKKPMEMAEAVPTIEEIVKAVEAAMQPKLDAMQSQIDTCMGYQTEMKATLSSVTATKATVHKPAVEVSKKRVNNGNNVSGTESRIMAMLSK